LGVIQKNNIGQINHMWNPHEDLGFMALIKQRVLAFFDKVASAFKAA
jgi:hypothetical protein